MDTIHDERAPAWLNAVTLLIWLAAAVGVFLPFAVGTSPLNAVMLRVPQNEGNWWHVLIGAPFFLAFPILWLRTRAVFSPTLSTAAGRLALWIAAVLSMCATVLVEMPFLLHRAGTSEMQRLEVIASGLGLVAVSAAVLYVRRQSIPVTRALLAGLTAAYLANASLCLIVYGESQFSGSSRSGWFLTVIIVWPMLLDLAWTLSSRLRPATGR